MKWRPIKTAPKDGTSFIGVVKGYVLSQAHWDVEAEVWINDAEDRPQGGDWELTHWVPMPEFPES